MRDNFKFWLTTNVLRTQQHNRSITMHAYIPVSKRLNLKECVRKNGVKIHVSRGQLFFPS